MTTALESSEGSASRSGRFLPQGKTRYPLYRRLGEPQGRSGQVRKISPLTLGFDPRTVQPVASRYLLSYPAHYNHTQNNKKDQKNVVKSQHFATLHHTSPNYISLHLSSLHFLSFTLHYHLIWLNPSTFPVVLFHLTSLN
jgi:hypothetical protein